MAHTPGPWKARIHGGSTFWEANQPRICSGNKVIAVAKYYMPHFAGETRPEDSEIEANAMLMAAAPELLEVCLEVATEPYPDSDLTSLLETLRARAKVAIAKAQPNKPMNATVEASHENQSQ